MRACHPAGMLGGGAYARGEMAEWTIATVSKTVLAQANGGSNPPLSVHSPDGSCTIKGNNVQLIPRFPMDLTLIGQLISLLAVVAAGPLVIVFLAARRGAL